MKISFKFHISSFGDIAGVIQRAVKVCEELRHLLPDYSIDFEIVIA